MCGKLEMTMTCVVFPLERGACVVSGKCVAVAEKKTTGQHRNSIN